MGPSGAFKVRETGVAMIFSQKVSETARRMSHQALSMSSGSSRGRKELDEDKWGGCPGLVGRVLHRKEIDLSPASETQCMRLADRQHYGQSPRINSTAVPHHIHPATTTPPTHRKNYLIHTKCHMMGTEKKSLQQPLQICLFGCFFFFVCQGSSAQAEEIPIWETPHCQWKIFWNVLLSLQVCIFKEKLIGDPADFFLNIIIIIMKHQVINTQACCICLR